MVPGSSDFNEQQASIIVMDIFEFKGLKFLKDKWMRKLEIYIVYIVQSVKIISYSGTL